jgi:hypothetical protein
MFYHLDKKQHVTLSTTLNGVTSQPQEPKISRYFYKFLPGVFLSGIRTAFIRISQFRFGLISGYLTEQNPKIMKLLIGKPTNSMM